MTAASGERGQAMVLVVGVLLVCLAVTGVAVDLMRAALLRRSLQAVADSAVTLGGSQLDTSRYYASGGTRAGLDPELAVTRAREVVGQRRGVDSVHVTATGSRVRAFVSGRVRASFLRFVGVRHLKVSAVSTGEPVLGEG